MQSPILVRSEGAGHAVSTAILHLRRFAPALREGQSFKVRLILHRLPVVVDAPLKRVKALLKRLKVSKILYLWSEIVLAELGLSFACLQLPTWRVR